MNVNYLFNLFQVEVIVKCCSAVHDQRRKGRTQGERVREDVCACVNYVDSACNHTCVYCGHFHWTLALSPMLFQLHIQLTSVGHPLFIDSYSWPVGPRAKTAQVHT